MTEKRVVLIVDDVEQVGSVASEYLMRRIPDVLCYETTRPTEALAWLRTAPRVDMILSDQKMGEMEGTAFLAETTRLHPGALRVLMSAYLDLPEGPAALGRHGVHALVKKPWDWSEFTRFVVDLLAVPPAARPALAVTGPRQFPEGAFDAPAARSGPARRG